MVLLIMLIAIVLAAHYIVQLWREDTTINPNEFNKALAIPNKAKKSPMRIIAILNDEILRKIEPYIDFR